MKVKEESEKAGLKLNIQKTKIMVSSPISSVQLLSHVWLFVIQWTAARQASLSITNSWNLPKLMSIEWQPTPVFLPGESQGRGSLVGCRLWGRTESDTTEAT